MSVATFTKTGTKAQTPARLDKKVFGEIVASHELLKQAYHAYLANGRRNLAVAKTRGEIRGGGRKPWRQKGTGRARFGSSRNPIWRGGGITFGPTGEENYSRQLASATKRKAIRQALSLAAQENLIMVVDTFITMEHKTRDMVKFLDKIGAKGNILAVVSEKNPAKEQAVRNIANLRIVGASYLNVYDILNADSIVISQKALTIVSDWLKPVTVKQAKG